MQKPARSKGAFTNELKLKRIDHGSSGFYGFTRDLNPAIIQTRVNPPHPQNPWSILFSFLCGLLLY